MFKKANMTERKLLLRFCDYEYDENPYALLLSV